MAEDTTDALSPAGIIEVMHIVGSLLYYTLALDNTLLVALSDLSAAQLNATKATWDKIVWLLKYCASNPNAEVKYIANEMCLHTHSNASYLSAPKSRSLADAHFS